MYGEVSLTDRDQIRVMTLSRVLEGALTGAEGAAQLGVTLRHLRRLLAAYRAAGPATIPHGNRVRPPAHTVPASVRAPVGNTPVAYYGACALSQTSIGPGSRLAQAKYGINVISA